MIMKIIIFTNISSLSNQKCQSELENRYWLVNEQYVVGQSRRGSKNLGAHTTAMIASHIFWPDCHLQCRASNETIQWFQFSI
jgi:hypothetical protein